jgi:hypothetical protein
MKALVEMELVRALYDDRVREGKSRRREAKMNTADDVVIRRAEGDDSRRLRRLAELDSADLPASPTLVAEVDGVLVAALPLNGGRAIADPFVSTSPLVSLLELRASQLRPATH